MLFMGVQSLINKGLNIYKKKIESVIFPAQCSDLLGLILIISLRYQSKIKLLKKLLANSKNGIFVSIHIVFNLI
jgi:hypothetical protein